MLPSTPTPNTEASAEAEGMPADVGAVIAAKLEANILFLSEVDKPDSKFEFVLIIPVLVLYSGKLSCTAESAAIVLYDEGPANTFPLIKAEAPLSGFARCQSSSSSRQIRGGGALMPLFCWNV